MESISVLLNFIFGIFPFVAVAERDDVWMLEKYFSSGTSSKSPSRFRFFGAGDERDGGGMSTEGFLR